MKNIHSKPIRLHDSTVNALRIAASELVVATGHPINNDNDRVAALIDHWNRTKVEHYGRRPQLMPATAN